MSKFATAINFLQFLRTRKKMWLMPLVLALVILGVLLLVAESAVVAPFIYALF